MTEEAAVGFRPHIGWTTAVTVTGGWPPTVLSRGRIDLHDPAVPGSSAPHHAAEGLAGEQAVEAFERAVRAIGRAAGRAYEDVSRDLAARGYALVAVGVAGFGQGRLPDDPIVAFHIEEVRAFADALCLGGEVAGLDVLRFPDFVLYRKAAKHLAVSTDEVESDLRAAGRPLGPPWRKEEKAAALAAWLALEGR